MIRTCFKGRTRGFVGEVNVEYKRKRKVKDDSKVLGLNNWTDGVGIH